MNSPFGPTQCLSFINCQLQAPKHSRSRNPNAVTCITVSRQSGCGAHVFAEELAAQLQAGAPPDSPPWAIFDHSLVEAVLKDHHLPSRLAVYMPEDRVPQVADIIQELLSLHPPTEILVRQTTETILRLAELGNVIILGRGGNIITARMRQAFHVRLIGSLQRRLDHMKIFDKLNRKDALERVLREDGGRRRYLKRYFGRDIDDPLNYHVVMNTDSMALSEAAGMVARLASDRGVPKATVAAA